MSTSILLFFLSPLLKWVTTTYVLGALGIFLFFAWPAWLPGRRFSQYAGIAGLCAICSGTFYWYAFHAGERHMAQRIAAKDQSAIQQRIKSDKEVDACNGGVDWDASVGTCRPGSGAGQ